MEEPLVTIAIPFYNSDKFLAFAIQSVINQEYQNWELLLIDDGGSDGSLAIAKEFAATNQRIKVVYDGQNKHLAARLNESVRLAKGQYYARMDDDDIMTTDRIEKQVNYLMQHPDVDVVGASVMNINDKNFIVGSQDMSEICNVFIHPTVMARTQWFRENLYDETLPRVQDMDLWLRTVDNSKFKNIPEPLLFYRNTGTPIISRYIRSMQSLRMIARRYRIYNKNVLWCAKLITKTYIQELIYCLFDKMGKTDVLVRHRKNKELPESLRLSQRDIKESIKGLNCIK